MMRTIALLFGGNSLEHEISIFSAFKVYNSIDFTKYNVILIYISKDNEFYYCKKINDIEKFKDLNAVIRTSKKVSIKNIDHGHYFVGRFVKIGFDVAIPVVHGRGIEDGTIYGLLNFYQIPYVGGTLIESSVGMDKELSKLIALNNKVKIVPFFTIDYEKFDLETAKKKAAKLGYPLIIKANTLGSSIGIAKASNEQEFEDAIAFICQYDNTLLVEQFLTDFCEYNIALFENEGKMMFSAIEKIEKGHDFLNYEDKYAQQEKIIREIPAMITETLKNQIEKNAASVYQGLKANGLVRIDFLFDKEKQILYFSEINTIPGSLSCHLFEHSGVNFSRLLDTLIFKARKDHLLKKKYCNILQNNTINSLFNKNIFKK